MFFKNRRGAERVPRHVLWTAAFLAVMICAPHAGRAEPFVPADDGFVLETLPDAGDSAARRLRGEHIALAANPHDLALALNVARGDLDRARAFGDPRYLGRAQAALSPWPPSPSAPPDVTLLRSVIAQSNHDFTGALAGLAQVLRQRPDSAQAWVTQAAIHQAQADYPAALSDCGQLAGLVLGLAPDICTASGMSLTGHAALALRAVALSLQTNAAEAARTPGVAMWGLTLAAETAARLDDPSAESWFARALTLDPDDPYLLAAWSDWLLDHQRPREVIALLANRTRIDPLLLRLAIAEHGVGDTGLQMHVADLAARFDASRLRGDTVHRREEARFQLELMHDPAAAIGLAVANWTVQREPADARILLQSALAAGQPGAAAPVLAWLRSDDVEDTRLKVLAARLHGS